MSMNEYNFLLNENLYALVTKLYFTFTFSKCCLYRCFVGTKATAVELETVPCTAISMSMFDKLHDRDVVQEGGYIRKCLEEYIENVCLGDQLRNVSSP